MLRFWVRYLREDEKSFNCMQTPRRRSVDRDESHESVMTKEAEDVMPLQPSSTSCICPKVSWWFCVKWLTAQRGLQRCFGCMEREGFSTGFLCSLIKPNTIWHRQQTRTCEDDSCVALTRICATTVCQTKASSCSFFHLPHMWLSTSIKVWTAAGACQCEPEGLRKDPNLQIIKINQICTFKMNYKVQLMRILLHFFYCTVRSRWDD